MKRQFPDLHLAHSYRHKFNLIPPRPLLATDLTDKSKISKNTIKINFNAIGDDRE